MFNIANKKTIMNFWNKKYWNMFKTSNDIIAGNRKKRLWLNFNLFSTFFRVLIKFPPESLYIVVLTSICVDYYFCFIYIVRHSAYPTPLTRVWVQNKCFASYCLIFLFSSFFTIFYLKKCEKTCVDQCLECTAPKR